MAIWYYRVALKLDPEGSNAARMIEQITSDEKPGYTSGKKS